MSSTYGTTVTSSPELLGEPSELLQQFRCRLGGAGPAPRSLGWRCPVDEEDAEAMTRRDQVLIPQLVSHRRLQLLTVYVLRLDHDAVLLLPTPIVTSTRRPMPLVFGRVTCSSRSAVTRPVMT
jgi:hypothetical protein